jgi:flagellar biosynthesis protein FlhB
VAASKSGGEKTEDATPKKKKDARKEGTVAKSPEVVMWTQILVGSVLLKLTIGNGERVLRDLFGRLTDAVANPDIGSATALFGHGMQSALFLLAPLLFGMMLTALVCDLSQTKGNFAAKVIKPKAERISILKGAKRLFSPQGAWQAVKVLIKCTVLIAVGWGPLSTMTESLIGASRPPLVEVVGAVGSTAMTLGRNVALAGLVLAFADYLMMRKKITKDLKMTKQEVKDEYKQAEGDAQVKGQIRQRQREMSQNRMMADVADATVVIVNPTHVAVALKYDPASGAPRVVAKGRNDVALRIRGEAEKHGVPMVRDIPLARSIHAGCEVGQEIPAELFETVARLLAFVFSLDRRIAALRGVMPSPTAPAY